ncbi:hypothetical protein [Methanoculleus chikugoensis]|uniref:hypothetical protein n=1 Tax=Methanoculleus chikugoensis TaxID=118126 RepID=UPI001FB49E96|nr:hypothetical protein [Methanoculleus chikugoensis]
MAPLSHSGLDRGKEPGRLDASARYLHERPPDEPATTPWCGSPGGRTGGTLR